MCYELSVTMGRARAQLFDGCVNNMHVRMHVNMHVNNMHACQNTRSSDGVGMRSVLTWVIANAMVLTGVG